MCFPPSPATLPHCRLIDGAILVWREPLLRHIAGLLLTSYLTSSLLYFTRSVILLQSVRAANRVRWVSATHASSAVITLLLQLFVTGAPAAAGILGS